VVTYSPWRVSKAVAPPPRYGFRNGKVSVADGPFVETNEQLIRLFFINARDLNEAIHVASKMPQARGGPIEVRPMPVVGRIDSCAPTTEESQLLCK